MFAAHEMHIFLTLFVISFAYYLSFLLVGFVIVVLPEFIYNYLASFWLKRPHPWASNNFEKSTMFLLVLFFVIIII